MKRISLLMACVVAIAVMGTAFTTRALDVVYRFNQTFEETDQTVTPLTTENFWDLTTPSCDEGSLLCALSVTITSGTPTKAQIIQRFKDAYVANSYHFPTSAINVNDATGQYSILVQVKAE